MFKNLNLNRDKILETIKSFCESKFIKSQVKDFVNKGSTRRRVDIISEGLIFYIDFHFCDDGTTTIETTGGQHKEFKKELAEYIVSSSECVIAEAEENSKWVIADNINIEDFHIIVEILMESEYCKALSGQTIDSIKEMYRFKGKFNEKLSVFYYLSRKKVMIQGRPLMLFNEALSCVSELVETDKLPDVFKDYYEVKIDKRDIEKQVDIYLPNSFKFQNLKEKRALCQCIYNLNLDGDMFEYTFLLFPALRVLEEHLKKTLNTYSINYNREKGFDMFKKDDTGKRYILKEEYHNNIGSEEKVKYFGNLFTFFCPKRNNFFHWGDPTLIRDQTSEIENIGVAKNIIKDTFKYIDTYYIL